MVVDSGFFNYSSKYNLLGIPGGGSVKTDDSYCSEAPIYTPQGNSNVWQQQS